MPRRKNQTDLVMAIPRLTASIEHLAKVVRGGSQRRRLLEAVRELTEALEELGAQEAGATERPSKAGWHLTYTINSLTRSLAQLSEGIKYKWYR